MKNIKQITTSIWSAISFQKDKCGRILQSKQRSYSLPVLNEKETKQNISSFIKSLRNEHTVPEILTLLMECLDEVKFQYMLSHNGFRLAKNIPKDKRISVADIYAFSQTITYCFSFLPPEKLVKPLSIVSGVMAPAGQDQGDTLLGKFWQTQGYTVISLGVKIKPRAWLEAIDKYQPNFLSISCMLSTCIANLREFLTLLSERSASLQICVGGIAIDKFKALQLSQEYRIPILYGADLISIQKYSKPASEDQIYYKNTVNLPEEILALVPGEKIFCYPIPLSEIIIDGNDRQETKILISNFNSAVIVTTTYLSATKHNEKMLIWQLLQIENFLENHGHLAISFSYPLPCPFCLPSDCRKAEDSCMNSAYTRPFPKDFHINLPKTMNNARIPDLGLSSLILVK